MLIGISGYAQSGKDTFANVLVKNHGFTRVAFAELLKESLYVLDPIVDQWGNRVSALVDEYGWDRCKQIFPEMRFLLQRMGTEVGRQLLHENLWVDAAFNKLDLKNGHYCVSDMRFPNEALRIVDNDGLTVRMNRDGVGPANAHPGEVALDNWSFDYVVENNQGIQYLEQVASDILHKGYAHDK